MVQVRAHIFLQSVNVIRNMDYLARCIKTEVQRLSSESKARKAQLPRRLAASGLQLLLALLPHSSPLWQEEALQGEPCHELASVIFARRALRGVAHEGGPAALLSRSYEDSRKRLWLLFRMVHLSSAIPTEVQGKLSALMDSYLRPVLVERRLPTGYCQALDRGLNTQAAMLEDEEPEQETAIHPPLFRTARTHASIGGAWWRVLRAEPGRMQDTFSFVASTASQSKVSNSSGHRLGSDTSKAVRRLFATRGDLLQVLKRLPPQALVSQAGCSTQIEGILRGICTSVVVGVSPELVHQGPGSPMLVGLGVGYRYGKGYVGLPSGQSTLELSVAVPTPGGWEELSLPFPQLADTEPSSLDALQAWSDLSAALPLRFNDAALRVRRRNLKKAKENGPQNDRMNRRERHGRDRDTLAGAERHKGIQLWRATGDVPGGKVGI
ncbi:unnamed protein product [Durusdinium trenchii]|uniref:Uncharacterized protein n=1 Tax=Durusdinium trenchii TaxID=1381693 RepID=A0ABP0IHC5_9DINO